MIAAYSGDNTEGLSLIHICGDLDEFDFDEDDEDEADDFEDESDIPNLFDEEDDE